LPTVETTPDVEDVEVVPEDVEPEPVIGAVTVEGAGDDGSVGIVGRGPTVPVTVAVVWLTIATVVLSTCCTRPGWDGGSCCTVVGGVDGEGSGVGEVGFGAGVVGVGVVGITMGAGGGAATDGTSGFAGAEGVAAVEAGPAPRVDNGTAAGGASAATTPAAVAGVP
jgi:hypothetical protein